jgi:hypothetical protein
VTAGCRRLRQDATTRSDAPTPETEYRFGISQAFTGVVLTLL